MVPSPGNSPSIPLNTVLHNMFTLLKSLRSLSLDGIQCIFFEFNENTTQKLEFSKVQIDNHVCFWVVLATNSIQSKSIHGCTRADRPCRLFLYNLVFPRFHPFNITGSGGWRLQLKTGSYNPGYYSAFIFHSNTISVHIQSLTFANEWVQGKQWLLKMRSWL